MKHVKFTILLTVLMSMIGVKAFAHDFAVANDDGKTIYYKITGNTTVAVSYSGSDYNSVSNEYTGNIVIPESVTYNGTTYNVTSIAYAAFEYCSSLTSVTIPRSVTSIDKYAFSYIEDLSSITIPTSVTTIGDYAFIFCSGLTSINVEKGNPKYDSRNNCNAIIETSSNTLIAGCQNTVIPNSVTTIGVDAFAGCSGLTSIIIPNSVTSIGQSAFWYCTSLTSITIPASVTSIRDYAFIYSGLTSVTIPSSITCITDNTFDTDYSSSGCNSLSVNIEVLDYSAFCNNEITEKLASNNSYIKSIHLIDKKGNEIKEYVIPEDVTSIGDYTFAGCSALASVAIGESVESIGKEAFHNCSNLTSITIGNSVANIGRFAFWNCTSLTSVTIPNSVTSIGESAFYNCSGLTSIVIPNSVTSIGGYAFSGTAWYDNQPDGLVYAGKFAYKYKGTMPKNTSITIKEGTVGIVDGVFYNCNNLTSVIIPSSVTTIGKNVFFWCTSLTSVTIPNSVTSIGEAAFNNCSGLTSITIPNSVTSIGNEAFYGCRGLTSITIPNSVATIGDYAFAYCSGLTAVTVKRKNPLTISSSTFYNRTQTSAYTYSEGTNAILYVPIGSKNAYEAVDYWWRPFKEIVEIPSPTIAFADTNVKTICVANWDTSGDGELSEEEAEAVTSLGQVFKGNKKLTSFEELEYFTGLTSIGRYAFYGCEGLTSITIPNSVTSIGNEAFYGCGLTSITIPNNVTTIGEDAFRVCNNLASITIGNGVTTIGDNAFSWCKDGIASIVVSSGNKTFDSRDGCNAIISSNTNTLLVGCKNTVIPNSVTGIGRAFLGCYGLNSITIPNSVTSIGDYAFCGCYDLKSVSIPNSVTSIGDHAFYGYNKLTSITIPNSVTSIGSDAFGLCELTSVTVNNTEPLFIESSTFSNKANATLYVPYGCKAAYEAADYWKEFKEIVEMPAETNSHLTINSQTICKGGKISLPVSMENEEEITAFQFDVVVPEGITLTDVQLGDRKCDSHTIDYNKQADGTYRVIGVSLLSELFSDNEGELVRLILSSDKDIEKGDYSVSVKNIVLTSLSKGKLYPADVSSVLTVLGVLQGDADGDGILDVADIVAMVNYILEIPSSDFVFLAADMNADGEVDIFDVMIAINLILNWSNSSESRARAISEGNALEPMYMTVTDNGIRLDIDDAGKFTAFQFDVEVTEGTELIDAILTGSEDTHLIRTAKTGENSYRVIVVSLNNSTFMTTDQGLLRLSLSDNSRFAVIDNIKFVTPLGESVYFSISQKDSTTGIKKTCIGQDEIIYDLSGRKVGISRESLPKGIYIINNKKFVIE